MSRRLPSILAVGALLLALAAPLRAETMSVSPFTISGVAGFGTGVATALAVNIGSAGAPVLFNGALGTPSSGTLTSATGLPISTGLTGAGTGALTALAVNVGSAGAFVTFNGAGGTPSSLTATNLSGTAASLTAGNVTTNANLTGPITSVGNATSIASQTGTGTTFVMSAAPTVTTLTISAIAADTAQADSTVCVNSSGLLLKGTGTIGICLGTSSARFKQLIVPQQDGLGAILALRPKMFRYIAGYGDDGAREQYGFMAEDVVSILPRLVGLDRDALPNSVDMVGMIPVMVLAIQQQQTQIEQLKLGR